MSNGKGAFTLILAEGDAELLEELSARKDLSKTEVVRRALRMYQAVENRLGAGERLVFVDEETGQKFVLIVV